MTIALLVVAITATVAATIVLAGRASTWEFLFGNPDLGAFDRYAPSRSPTPNDALMCTPGLCDGVAVDASLPEYDALPEILIARVDAAMVSLGMPIRRVDDGVDPAKSRYVTYTRLMHFPDTTSFEAVLLPDGHTGLVAYARAQIGRYDFGTNRKRLEQIGRKLKGA